MTKSWHAIAKGRVQGVGFRYIATEFAKQYGVTGFVRNLPDGTVEVLAQGDSKKVEAFFSALSKQFRLSEPLKITEKEDSIHQSFELRR